MDVPNKNSFTLDTPLCMTQPTPYLLAARWFYRVDLRL
jgi:hypothetical protein